MKIMENLDLKNVPSDIFSGDYEIMYCKKPTRRTRYLDCYVEGVRDKTTITGRKLVELVLHTGVNEKLSTYIVFPRELDSINTIDFLNNLICKWEEAFDVHSLFDKYDEANRKIVGKSIRVKEVVDPNQRYGSGIITPVIKGEE